MSTVPLSVSLALALFLSRPDDLSVSLSRPDDLSMSLARHEDLSLSLSLSLSS